MSKKFSHPVILLHAGVGARKKPQKEKIVFLEELARQVIIEFQSARAIEIVPDDVLPNAFFTPSPS